MNKITSMVAAAAILFSIGAASAADRRVLIINHTKRPIVQVLGSNVGEQRWEYDFLGSDVIDAYDQAIVNINDGSGYCKFDLKAIDSTGGAAVHWNMNVCTTNTWHLY